MVQRDDDRSGRRQGSAPRDAQPRRNDNRVPPHNLDAEESLLGALLLSRDVVGNVAELGLQVEHFYKPAHQHVYAAIRGLMATGQPIDVVTVADELRRAGLLDEIGGAQLLLDLQNATPAISNANRYAKIVQDTAVLRRLIGVASEIAEIAYQEPDDVTKALDEAESRVFEVAEDRVVDSTRALTDLLPLAMDQLQQTFERGDSITGTATGYNDLDEILSGLQPSTLNIVGARPAMGKCVAWDTPIVDPTTGEMRTAEEWYLAGVAGEAVHCSTLDDSGRVATARFAAFYGDGVKELFLVRTRSGRTLRITEAHPLLSAKGWRALRDLTVGTSIAIPAQLPVFGCDELTSDTIADLVARAVCNGRVPAPVFTARRTDVSAFLHRLFAVDSSASVARSGVARVSFTTTSERLSLDVMHLLLRFGVRCTRRNRAGAPVHVRGCPIGIDIVDPHSLVRFCSQIGILGAPADVQRVLVRAEELAATSCGDELPVEVWADVAKARGARSWADVTSVTDSAGLEDGVFTAISSCPSRRTIAALADELDSDVLRRWASPDVAWDPIVSIEPCGADRIYDFNVPGTHNFVAADVFVHNTAFGLGMATHVATITKKPVLMFSLEMGHAELTQRILSAEARVDSQKLRTGRLIDSDWTKIGKAINRLEVPLFLDDNPRVTVMEIRAKARRTKARFGGLALIVIDYLQLMSGGSHSENRQLEVSEISRGLKILARELEVPIVALSQLSRNLETRADKRPMLADLRESGSLEQDADVVMFLYRDEIYNRDSADKGAAEVIIAKHRSGPTGHVRLVFNGTYTRFDNAARGI
jgi:replicative DNA helicase